jgi:hypothetical protein
MMGWFKHCFSQRKEDKGHSAQEIKGHKKRDFSASLWPNNTILFMQYTQQFLVHNKHTCWGGLAIIASREEDKVYCCRGAEVVPMRWDWWHA